MTAAKIIFIGQDYLTREVKYQQATLAVNNGLRANYKTRSSQILE